MNNLQVYFPDLTEKQLNQFEKLTELYAFWNAQINVISRKDMDDFFERHVLHSLGIAKIMKFEAGSAILDIGTGGGFPGIPLAIMFPDSCFHLVDSVGKKIKVVIEIAAALGLTNVTATHARAEDINEQFDFIVSRAVTAMPAFLPWTKSKFLKLNKNDFKNGILYLKGGDLSDEMNSVSQKWKIFPLNKIFPSDFFETKAVVYVQMT